VVRCRRVLAVVVVVGGLALVGCGGGEDRPGEVTTEGGGAPTGSASGTHSGSGTHAGSATGTGAHGEDTPPAFPESEADTRVAVALQDFAFVGVPATVKGPKLLFSAENKGPSPHELEVVDAGGKAVGEIHEFPKGATKTLAVRLEPGSYSLQCLVMEGDRTHADLGMKTALTVE
jgi:hypothetical protein